MRRRNIVMKAGAAEYPRSIAIAPILSPRSIIGSARTTRSRSRLTSAPAAETLLYQLLGAFVMLLVTAVLTAQTAFHPSATAWASLAFQTLLVSFASYLAWFWLLRQYIASRLGVFSFLTPLFGVAFGVWLLHELLETSFGAGAVLVLAGIVLVSAAAWLTKRPPVEVR